MATDSPLTFGQLSTWRSIETFAADRLREVNVPAIWDLRGISLPSALEAVRQLTAAHESLRTTYHLSEGQPVQRVHAEAAPPVEIADHPADAPADPAQTLRELHHRPFEVTGDPGWRALLATAGGDPDFLALSMSHMAVDVTAVQLLETQFRGLAAGPGNGTVPALAAAPSPQRLALLQAGDGWLTRRRGAAKYWRKVLSDGPVRNLPSPPSRDQQYRIQATLRSHRLAVLAAQAASALKVSQQSMFTAATAVALAQLLDRDRVMLSLMCGNRFDPAWQPMVSTMNQLIPWVSPVDAQITVADYLKRSHFNALLAYRHSAYDVDTAASLIEGAGFTHDCWFNYITETGAVTGATDGAEPGAEVTWTSPARHEGHPFYVRVNGDGRSWTSVSQRADPDLIPAPAVVQALRTLALFIERAASEPACPLGAITGGDRADPPPTVFPTEVGGYREPPPYSPPSLAR